MQITLTFNKPLNNSISVGDTAWYVPVAVGGGYNTATANSVQLLGTIISVSDQYLRPKLIVSNNTMSVAPTINSSTFIMFQKNNKANLTSLKGYYAEATLENNSKEKAELFAVSSEIVQSSK
tara:strand:- start:3720 stop:4085 length:366 start_codon:yes stop_codon:yes gene_type:complete